MRECDVFQGGEDCDGEQGTETRDDSGGYLPAKHFCKSCAAAYDHWLDNYDGPLADADFSATGSPEDGR